MGITADALLFDNDGTLVSSIASVERCWNRWAAECGVPASEFAAVPRHGRTAAEIVADLLPPPRRAAGLARIHQLEFDDLPGGVVPLPDTAGLLALLPRQRWAVVTSATRRLGEARLRAAGVDAPLVVAADDVTRGKPDPEPFLLAAARLGVAPERCVVLEDAPAGLAAGRAAGMRTVALTTTHRAEELSADLVVPDLSALSVQVTAVGITLAARPGEAVSGRGAIQHADERLPS
ncbi:HAD-IA family hydrolase [Streptomyces sp. 549]|uniref:HAD-IA family hydrolase n=1 Tax=Streptomyces sp. 549 TaxID=3049076 RepID=UPI0024C24BC3|nr:HAD-IA family hydrolase [Streptomyces sp. 549]MDK1473454.1 HAD-IA family hydrolase [Streptomyces sp. 549]